MRMRCGRVVLGGVLLVVIIVEEDEEEEQELELEMEGRALALIEMVVWCRLDGLKIEWRRVKGG
jgi:hypothetical protein